MNKTKNLWRWSAMAMLSLSLSLVSCEDEITEEKQTTSEDQLFAKSSTEKCEFQPYGLYFNNGVTSDCDHNMMHFPSWESFAQTLEQLETAIDTHEDNFLNSHGHLSEDPLNDLEESISHHPDQPLIDYEDSHHFCSLRKFEEAAENAWLDASDQPGWTFDDWAENQFIVDPVEQTLYNPQNEVMICNFIYKEMAEGWLIVDSTHPDASSALGSANEGNSLEQVIQQFGGNEEQAGAASAEFINPNACFYKSSDSKGVQLSGSYAMKKSNQMRNRTFDFTDAGNTKVFKAFTRNYKKKNSKWRKRRISSSARIYGDTYEKDSSLPANSESDCIFKEEEDVQGRYRKKRRSKAKLRRPYAGGEEIGTIDDALFSEHRQRPFYETLEFEN
ncbi:hypothetical protein BST97_08835 [Nonlabens spongiae]|uniref:Uncharacterized protein n=1 Tax=Nonlabens spongiae TaxID=331648 RepID=A0A1W6MKF4_9FLAO|nr:hypothetical protein [Nonlabens spongiae]ARN78094.1 hypothetical protein BST97_08835 [Nonlabens spongiae]